MLSASSLLWASGTLLFWAYMASTFVFKIWYLATVPLCWLVACLLITRRLRPGRLLEALALPTAYFLWLALTALWADDLSNTLLWVAIDSIGLVVYALGYLLGRSCAPRQLIALWVACPVGGVLLTIATALAWQLPGTRSPYTALTVLPFCVPWCWLRLLQGPRRAWAALALLTTITFLLIASSRAPLAVALGLFLLTPWLAGRTWGQACRWGLGACVLGAGMVGLLWLLPMTQPFLARTAIRVTLETEVFGLGDLEDFSGDQIRKDLNAQAWEAWRVHGLIGMGYMQFGPRWFLGHYSLPMDETMATSLHRSLATWAVEGGLPCLVLVVVLLGVHGRALWQAWQRATVPAARDIVLALSLSLGGLLVLGWHHQAHQSPTWWVVLGMARGWSARRCGAVSDRGARASNLRRSAAVRRRAKDPLP